MGGPSHNGLGLPHQSLTEKMLHRLAYSPVLLRHFLNPVSLFSDVSNLCQAQNWLAEGGSAVPEEASRGQKIPWD